METLTATVAAVPETATFAVFLAPEPVQATDGGGGDAAGDAGQDDAGAGVEAPIDSPDAAPLENYVMGVADALAQRLQDKQLKDEVEDFLDALKAALDQFFKDMAAPPTGATEAPSPPAAPPGPPAVGTAANDEPAQAAVRFECGPAVWTQSLSEVQSTPAAAPGPAADVFTCVELPPTTAAASWPPDAGEGLGRSVYDVGPALLTTYLAWQFGLEGGNRDGEERPRRRGVNWRLSPN